MTNKELHYVLKDLREMRSATLSTMMDAKEEDNESLFMFASGWFNGIDFAVMKIIDHERCTRLEDNKRKERKKK